MKVRLTTRAGELVTEGTIPDFDPAPEILQWGGRLFTLDRGSGVRARRALGKPLVYVEGCLWEVPIAPEPAEAKVLGGVGE